MVHVHCGAKRVEKLEAKQLLSSPSSSLSIINFAKVALSRIITVFHSPSTHSLNYPAGFSFTHPLCLVIGILSPPLSYTIWTTDPLLTWQLNSIIFIFIAQYCYPLCGWLCQFATSFYYNAKKRLSDIALFGCVHHKHAKLIIIIIIIISCALHDKQCKLYTLECGIGEYNTHSSNENKDFWRLNTSRTLKELKHL